MLLSPQTLLHNISNPVLGIITLLVICYVVLSVVSWRRLRTFNGPFATSFSYLWMLRALSSGQMPAFLLWAGNRYGTTFRVGPNDLLTADPEVLRRMGAARSRYARSNWYAINRLDPDEDSMFSIMDTAEHDKLKAKTALAYSGKDVPGLEADIDSVIAELVDKIRCKYAVDPHDRARNPRTMPLLDLVTIVQYFTLDSITKIAFGERLGFPRTESDLYGHLGMLRELMTVLNIASAIPFLAFLTSLRWVQTLAVPTGENARGIYKILPFVLFHI